jgi:hypothetical protein
MAAHSMIRDESVAGRVCPGKSSGAPGSYTRRVAAGNDPTHELSSLSRAICNSANAWFNGLCTRRNQELSRVLACPSRVQVRPYQPRSIRFDLLYTVCGLFPSLWTRLMRT